MNIPDDLLYTDHDEWLRVEGNTVTVGISDYAQDQLGELVHVELPEVGAELSAGDMACEVESVKAVAEVYAPVSGTVSEVNEALEDGAEGINEDPYGQWIFKLTVDGPVEGFLDAAAYRAKVS
jgi:glycine cleavage system H protein